MIFYFPLSFAECVKVLRIQYLIKQYLTKHKFYLTNTGPRPVGSRRSSASDPLCGNNAKSRAWLPLSNETFARSAKSHDTGMRRFVEPGTARAKRSINIRILADSNKYPILRKRARSAQIEFMIGIHDPGQTRFLKKTSSRGFFAFLSRPDSAPMRTNTCVRLLVHELSHCCRY